MPVLHAKETVEQNVEGLESIFFNLILPGTVKLLDS